MMKNAAVFGLVISLFAMLFSPVAYATPAPSCVLDVDQHDGGDWESMDAVSDSALHVTVLGAETNDDVRLRYKINSGSYHLIWNDAREHINDDGTPDTFVDSGDVLVFEGRKGWAGLTVKSNDEGPKVEILVNGNNLNNLGLGNDDKDDIIAMLGARWTGSRNGGHVVLGSDQAVVIYELETNDNWRPSFDMDDLVILVDVDCSFKVVANKIVCDLESDLPDAADGQSLPYIDGAIGPSTAQDWVSFHDSCDFAQNWTFQWAQAHVSNPGNNAGLAGGSWIAFSPTDANGQAVAEIYENAESHANCRDGKCIWMREAMKTGDNGYTSNGYVEFAGTETEGDDVYSAELYCGTDVLKYDNFDRVDTPVKGGTYYCVAFNVPNTYCGDGLRQDLNAHGEYEECDGVEHCSEECTWLPYCGDGVVNQESEECDGTDGCRDDCTLEEVTIIANKLVCDVEAELPNWGYGPAWGIDSETATAWVEEHGSCHMEANWSFQWKAMAPGEPIDSSDFPAWNSGEAEGWNTMVTGEDGAASAVVHIAGTNNIGVREAWEEGYVPFSGSADSFSPEVYCHLDVLAYDNQEVIGALYEPDVGLVDGATYYCTAWNVPEAYCGDNEVQSPNMYGLNEECDGGDDCWAPLTENECTFKPVTISARKIVCDVESELPNWGAGGPDITGETADGFIATHSEHCGYAADWNFQWGYDGQVGNPGDNAGAAEGGWHTFGQTDAMGYANVTLDLDGSTRLWMREVPQEGYIDFTGVGGSNFSAEMYCHQDVLNYDNYDYIQNPVGGNEYSCVAWNVPNTFCGDGITQAPNMYGQMEECDGETYCTEQCTNLPVTIVAHKIVCDLESDLPNWGLGDPSTNVYEGTAQAWVDSHQSCHFADGWTFQWAYYGVANPPDNQGALEGWNSSSPTDANGMASMVIDKKDAYQFELREAWQEGYIPFTGDNRDQDYSAEFYCHEDVGKYDNHDFVRSPQYAETYYCIGWNVPDTYCGDGQVQEPNAHGQNEQCDDGNTDSGDGCSAECTNEQANTNGDWVPSEDQGDGGVLGITGGSGNEGQPSGSGTPLILNNLPPILQPLVTGTEGGEQPGPVQFIPGSYWNNNLLPGEGNNGGAPGAGSAFLAGGALGGMLPWLLLLLLLLVGYIVNRTRKRR